MAIDDPDACNDTLSGAGVADETEDETDAQIHTLRCPW
jgi:hypothetical protein